MVDEFKRYGVLITHSRQARIFTLFKSSGFERLILASTEDQLISTLYDHLHSYLQERVVARFKADSRDNRDKLRIKALETAQDWEREHEAQILDQLLEEHNSGGKAQLGVVPVLEALSFGQVHTLIQKHNL